MCHGGFLDIHKEERLCQIVKRQKNDAADAEAICEAAQRPSLSWFALEKGRAAEWNGIPS